MKIRKLTWAKATNKNSLSSPYDRQYCSRGNSLEYTPFQICSSAKEFGLSNQCIRAGKRIIHQENSILDGINKILSEGLICKTEEELGMKCLAILEKVTQSKFGFIGKINSQGNLDGIAMSNHGWDACKMVDKTGHRRMPKEFIIRGPYGRVLLNGKGFYTNDPTSYQDSIGLPEGHPPMHSFLGVPLKNNEKTVGVVALANCEGGYCTQDLRYVETIAHAIMQVFLYLRKQEELYKSRFEIETKMRFLDALLANTSDVIWAWNREKQFIYANSPLEKVWGLSRDEYIGKTGAELGFSSEQCALFHQQIEQVFESEKPVTGEIPYTNQSKVFGYWNYVLSPVVSNNGSVELVAGVSRDITERKRIEDESEAKYQDLFNSIDEGFFLMEMIFDANDLPIDIFYIEANAAATRMLGQDYTGKRLSEIDPNFESYWFEIMGDVARTGKSVRLERYSDPNKMWFDFYVFRVGEANSRRIGNIFKNVTEQKRRENNIAFLADTGEDFSRLVSSEDIMKSVGKKLYQFFGLSGLTFLYIDEAEDVMTTVYDKRENYLVDDIRDLRISDFISGDHLGEIKDGQVITVHDVTTDLRVADRVDAFKKLGVQAQMIVPYVSEGIVRFIVVLQKSEPYKWQSDEVSLILNLAPRLSFCLERARAEEERIRAKALAVIDSEKTAFFSNVSHEFRTPLTLMLSPLEDLIHKSAAFPAEVRNDLSLIRNNSLRLLKLVNSLLDFSSIEAERVKAVYQPTDLAACTAELASIFQSAIENAGMILKVECPPLLQPIYIDREMWEKIVLNLLSNALKFTFEGEITVTLQWYTDYVALEVKDTGIGISSEEMPHIFERFHCIKGLARTHEGTGIGLTLVQELVKLHGGTVEATSVPGVGTTFKVCIPTGSAHLPKGRIDATKTAFPPALRGNLFLEEAMGWLPKRMTVSQDNQIIGGVVPEPNPTTPSKGRSRVLLAEDNVDMRNYIERLLSQYYDVEAVADGRAALTAAKANLPDLILTDIMMPGLNGFELLGALRTDPILQTLPVIVLSASAGEESRITGLEAGADDYIIKPFSSRELIAKVKANLEIASLRKKVFFEQVMHNEAERLLKIEKEMVRFDRLNLIGEMAASIGHEVRNPMTTVRGYLQVFQTKLEFVKYKEQLVTMIEELDRANDIIKEFLSLAKNKAIVMQKGNLGDILNTLFPLIQADAFRMNHQVRLEMEQIPDNTFDEQELRQLILNLTRNSLEAMQFSGTLTLKTYCNTDSITLEVEDTGPGIPDHVFKQIGKPFVTTKENGTGLGLPVCYRIADRHGAEFDVQTSPQGTTIRTIFKR